MNQLKYFLKVNFNFTYAIIAICTVLFLIVWIPYIFLAGGIDANPVSLVNFGANFGSFVQMGEYWRLITANFLHGSVLHLVFNMYSLYTIGNFVESYFSRTKFFTIFILTGVVASFTSYIFNNTGFSVGASGAIFGLLGLLLAQTIKTQNSYLPELPIDKRNLILIILLNLVFGFIVPGIDNMAHIGGLVSGFLLGFVIKTENSEIDSKYNSLIKKILLALAVVFSVYGFIGLILNLFSH
ncbi:MAG: rhomboid family intramembrane serine protease [bacterium]